MNLRPLWRLWALPHARRAAAPRLAKPRLGVEELEGRIALSASGASDVLQALAAITDASTAMAQAAIQAQADVSIGRISAEAALQLTQIAADTNRYLADAQQQIALYQAQAAQVISQTNQDAQTQRLAMQLAELRAARDDAMSAQAEVQQIQGSFDDQRIQLAVQQAEQDLALATQALNAQLVQAGLTSGAAPTPR
jgi:hypothetical protein